MFDFKIFFLIITFKSNITITKTFVTYELSCSGHIQVAPVEGIEFNQFDL